MKFFCFSTRIYERDFRKYFIEALRAIGHDVRHIRIGRVTIVTNPPGEPIKFHGLVGFFRLLRFLRAEVAADARNVYFDSTDGCTFLRLLTLHAFLPTGTWCMDIYDNLLFDYRGLKRFKRWLSVTCLSFISPIHLICSRELLRLFPKAEFLAKAAHTRHSDRDHANWKDLVVLASVDRRFDFDFVKKIAAEAPDRAIYIHGRIVNNDAAVRRKMEDLCSEKSNVIYRGEYQFEDIDAILAPYAVGFAPYVTRSELTDYIDPDKYYFFLSSGMEVISTDIPQARHMSEHIHIAVAPSDLTRIMSSLQHDASFRKNVRRTTDAYSWTSRVREFVAIVDRHADPCCDSNALR